MHFGTRPAVQGHVPDHSIFKLSKVFVSQMHVQHAFERPYPTCGSHTGWVRSDDQHSSQHVSNLTLLQNRVPQASEECFSSLLLLKGFSDPYTSAFLPVWASASGVTVATGSSQPNVPQTLKLDVNWDHFAMKCSRA